jgi:hypothetical protein
MGSLALRPDDSLTILTMALSIGYKSSVSLPPAIQATGPLTLTPVGLPPTEHASLCLDTPQIKIYAVRPKGADYQWGEVPPKQLSVGLGSLRASQPGNWPRRSLAIKPTYGG